jgi:hypothetical protein
MPPRQVAARLSEGKTCLAPTSRLDDDGGGRLLVGSQHSQLEGKECVPEKPVEKERARAAQRFSSKQSQRWVATIRIIKNWQILRQTPAAELPQLGLNYAENRSEFP